MSALVKMFERLATATESAAFLVHHVAKESGRGSGGGRGKRNDRGRAWYRQDSRG